MELIRFWRTAFLTAAACLPDGALAQDEDPARPDVGVEGFVSSDSDDTEIVRLAADFDLRNYESYRRTERLGVRVERAWYSFADGDTRTRERVFLQAADTSNGWTWQARVGTDGDTIIGSASVNDNAPFRKEVFVERDVIATPRGVDEGLYATFIGAAVDLPASESTVFTALAGVQTFTGDNVRLHLGGNAIQVIDADLGLSAQVRGRYFTNSDPREFDYYSPEWYAEILPVVQMRRFVGGWQLLGAGGLGAQRDSDSDWRRATYLNARVVSPEGARDWSFRGEITYTSTPSATARTGAGYDYFQATLGVKRRF
ncbi:MAG: hypothetical protein WBA68_01540 [Alteraurantiacibacter sp.]